jgi:hypothetical protein
MLRTSTAPRLLWSRYPASVLARTTEGILLPLRMGAASVHFLAFIIVTQDRERLVPFSLATPYTKEEYDTQLNQINSSLAFTFLCAALTCAIFLSGVLMRHETLHFVQGLLHAGGAALLLAVWRYDQHTDRVWHAFLFFSLLPLLIDVLAVLLVWRRGLLWII